MIEDAFEMSFGANIVAQFAAGAAFEVVGFDVDPLDRMGSVVWVHAETWTRIAPHHNLGFAEGGGNVHQACVMRDDRSGLIQDGG